MTKRLWPLLAGFSLWALAFIALYGLQYLGCRFGWPPGEHRTVLVVAYGVSLALLVICLSMQMRALHKPPAPIERIGVGTTIAALAATAITLGPVAFASLCI